MIIRNTMWVKLLLCSLIVVLSASDELEISTIEIYGEASLKIPAEKIIMIGILHHRSENLEDIDLAYKDSHNNLIADLEKHSKYTESVEFSPRQVTSELNCSDQVFYSKQIVSVTVTDISVVEDIYLIFSNNQGSILKTEPNISKIEEHKLNAYQLAIRNANDRAEKISNSFGKNIGKMINVGPANIKTDLDRYMLASERKLGIQDSVEIKVSLKIKYQLVD